MWGIKYFAHDLANYRISYLLALLLIWGGGARSKRR